MTIWRVRTVLSSSYSGDDLTTFYFESTGFSSTSAGNAVEAFWTDMQPAYSTHTTAVIEPDIYEIDVTSGSILSVAPYGGGFSQAGSDSSDVLPLDAQGLITWTTGEWVSGRALKGRTFLPYATTGANDAGKPSATYQGHLATAAGSLMSSAGSHFVIWSRTHHVIYPVTDGIPWNQWASLGKRRV